MEEEKEIYYGDRRIYLHHDYPAETLAKRKAYVQVRRLLQEKPSYEFPQQWLRTGVKWRWRRT